MGLGTQRLALGAAQRTGEKTFLYSFDYFNPASFWPIGYFLPLKGPFTVRPFLISNKKTGPTHCTEIAYLFAVSVVNHYRFNADDWRMLEITTKLWANFAKYGYAIS
jgi:carboxylesterase type B